MQKAGRPDVVLFAQGILGDPDATDPSAVDLVLRTNLVGPAQLLVRLAAGLQQGACIAAISSVAGDRGRAKNPLYGAAKAGLDALLSALRQKLAPRGVRVLTIKPGFVDTPMTAGIEKGGPLWARPDQVAADIERAVAKGRRVVYTPWFWWVIMMIIRHLPWFVFRRLKI